MLYKFIARQRLTYWKATNSWQLYLNQQFDKKKKVCEEKRHSLLSSLYSTTDSSYLRSPVVCIREAVFTVSPNKQYRGILVPTTPATHGPRRKHSIKIKKKLLKL